MGVQEGGWERAGGECGARALIQLTHGVASMEGLLINGVFTSVFYSPKQRYHDCREAISVYRVPRTLSNLGAGELL